MRNLSLTVRTAAALLCALVIARADEIHLKDGRVLEGRVLAKDQGKVKLLRPYGEIELAADDVARIVTKRSVFDDYDDLAAAVAADSAAGHFALARWCGTKGLRRHRRRHLETVLRLETDHVAAREALGFHRVEGRWLPEAEAMPALGFVRHRGKWVKADERISAIARKEEARRIAKLQKTLNRLVARLYSTSETTGQRARDQPKSSRLGK